MTDKKKKPHEPAKDKAQDVPDDGVRRYTPEDMPYFRNLILEKISTTEANLASLEDAALQTVGDYTGDNSTYSLHMAEHGTDAQEREKLFMMIQRERKFLQHLNAALSRMKNGTYGYCRDTGRPIQFKRLEAVPHATLSIEAKRAREETGR